MYLYPNDIHITCTKLIGTHFHSMKRDFHRMKKVHQTLIRMI